jgi:hypothetical protein
MSDMLGIELIEGEGTLWLLFLLTGVWEMQYTIEVTDRVTISSKYRLTDRYIGDAIYKDDVVGRVTISSVKVE